MRPLKKSIDDADGVPAVTVGLSFLHGALGAGSGSLQTSVELGTSVFLIPTDFWGRSARSGVKNRDERLVVMNDVDKSV